jgi:formylglycine-generating enzyme required for sulfatase activity
VTLTGQNTADDYILVQFDLSWDNSFRDDVNWDACWVFVKFKVGGIWNPATLNTSGHTAPGGSTIDTPSDGTGIFIYRSANGTGTFSLTGVQLRWNYGTDGLADNLVSVTVKVIAIEMVYVTEGPFAAGDGMSDASQFTLTTINTADATVAPSGSGSLGGEAGGYPTGQTAPDNSTWPNGYNAFYCMKYEITQEQYVDFLNTLTYTQQATRTAVAPNSATGTKAMTIGTVYRNGIEIQTPGVASTTSAVYGCDYTADGTYNQGDDGQNVACNHLSWADGAAYADWAGLRPMTELEYEKACRGHNQAAVAGEYAWGTATIASSAYTLSLSGGAGEGIATNYSTTAGNCSYSTTDGSIDGPLRVGIFAAHGSNTGRMTSGAAYYGIMEMSGNLWERPVTIGNATGRVFTGIHGNGALDANGNADASNWPGTNALGAGFRGGSWINVATSVRVSGRGSAANTNSNRNNNNGFRCVRLAP